MVAASLIRVAATAIIWVVCGVGVWLVAPTNTIHLGASGLIFGWLVYLMIRGIFTRRVGEIILGMVLFFLYGVGAYLTGILATKYHFGLGLDFWLVIVLGIALGAATAAFFGLFAIRAGGVYFLMITLALGQCVWGLAYRWNSLTGGDNGLNLPGRPEFGIRLADDVTYFYLVFAFFVASLLTLYVLVRSPCGRR